jgi:hypothetical protein
MSVMSLLDKTLLTVMLLCVGCAAVSMGFQRPGWLVKSFGPALGAAVVAGLALGIAGVWGV